MSALIVYLHAPTGVTAAATEYRFAQSRDGQSVSAQGRAPASALPRLGVALDVVAIVPSEWLSWHAVDLPKGSQAGGATRLRAVLDGLLEDRVLDDTSNLHFAVGPAARASAASPDGTAVWVAACDKALLKAALAPLEAAGRPVSRIVPEFAPLDAATSRSGGASSEGASRTVYAVGEPGDAWLVDVHSQGVTRLPLQAVVVQQWLAQAARTLDARSPTSHEAPGNGVREIFAEPAVSALAGELLNLPVQLQQAPQRWLLALQAPWDLAQFDLSNSGRLRAFKKLGDAWANLCHAPRWRAARWGVGLALVANVVGLNAWAWKEHAALTQQRKDVQSVLTQTFPQVKVVVDAPIQMGRELALLRQSTGAPAPRDLENLLSAVGQASAAVGKLDVVSLDYAEGELRLRTKGLTEEQVTTLQASLSGLGYGGRMAQDTLTVAPAANRPPSTPTSTAANPAPGGRP
jgi:general secretion pathway protein L